MTNLNYDVALFGSVFVDHILTGFTAWPQPGQETFATDYHREAGGGCFNTACGLAKLGCSANCFALVGETDGDWVTERVREFGVITENIRFSRKPTGLTVSVSMPSDRSFFTFEGANTELIDWLAEPGLVDRLAKARHIHFALALPPTPGISIIQALRARGRTVSLDVGWDPKWFREPDSLEVLRQIDLFLPNRAEAQAITGETSLKGVLGAFERIGVKTVALKLGPDGAALLAGGDYVEAAPLPTAKVDTTGAGDAFNAGFLHAFLENLPLPACLQRGVVCGSLSVRRPGSIASFPTIQEVIEIEELIHIEEAIQNHENCSKT